MEQGDVAGGTDAELVLFAPHPNPNKGEWCDTLIGNIDQRTSATGVSLTEFLNNLLKKGGVGCAVDANMDAGSQMFQLLDVDVLLNLFLKSTASV